VAKAILLHCESIAFEGQEKNLSNNNVFLTSLTEE